MAKYRVRRLNLCHLSLFFCLAAYLDCRTKTPGLSTGRDRRVGKEALLFLFSC
jgi:hypothetical protein